MQAHRSGAPSVVVLIATWHALFAMASWHHLYPYGESRLALLFLGPTTLLVVCGLQWCASWFPGFAYVLVWALAITIASPALRGTWRENLTTPMERQEMRPLLASLSALRRPSDSVWVSRGAQPAYLYYTTARGEPAAPGEIASPAGATILGPSEEGTTGLTESLQRALALGHGRVWAVFAHRREEEEQAAWQALPHARIVSRINFSGVSAVLVKEDDPG